MDGWTVPILVLLSLTGALSETSKREGEHASSHHGQMEYLQEVLMERQARSKNTDLQPGSDIDELVQNRGINLDTIEKNNLGETDEFAESYHPKFKAVQHRPRPHGNAHHHQPKHESHGPLAPPVYDPLDKPIYFPLREDQLEKQMTTEEEEGAAPDDVDFEPNEDFVPKEEVGDKEEVMSQEGDGDHVKEESDGVEVMTPDDTPDLPTPAALSQGSNGGKQASLRDVASMTDIYFLAVVAACSVAGLVGLVVAGVCWYRLQRNVKAASEAEYPAYGVTGPTKERVSSPGDRKLAQSAQMYHYQHQKQQMIALEKANSEMKDNGSDDDSEEENEEGDYTVYECPGLAPTGEMEVKNPLFADDTPATPSPATGERKEEK